MFFSALTRVVDYISVLEGALLTRRSYDNRLFIRELAIERGWCMLEPERSSRVDCGVILLSNSPMHLRKELLFPPDSVHIPGGLLAEIEVTPAKSVLLIGVHLIPELPNTCFSYLCCNMLNKIMGRDPRKLRALAYDALQDHFGAGMPSIIAGDFNDDGNTSAHLDDFLGKAELVSAMPPTVTVNDGSVPNSIDYVLISHKTVSSVESKVVSMVQVSDHDAVWAHCAIELV